MAFVALIGTAAAARVQTLERLIARADVWSVPKQVAAQLGAVRQLSWVTGGRR